MDSKEGVIQDMVGFIRQYHEKEAGIIYTFSRKEAEEVADALCGHGIVARAYHSDVSDARKKAVHESWMRNETQVWYILIIVGCLIGIQSRYVVEKFVSYQRLIFCTGGCGYDCFWFGYK